MWNPNVFETLLSFEGKGFMEIQIIWNGLIIYIMNIYSSCFIPNKIRLQSEFLKLKSSFPQGEWCVERDFNAMKRERETKGTRYKINTFGMDEFSNFIVDMSLVDLLALGNNLLCFNLVGDPMSRLDHLLISEGLIEKWGLKGKLICN